MSEEQKDESTESAETADSTESTESAHQGSTDSGPTFTEAPDPLAGLKKNANSVMDSMEGKTVSMKTYVGTIIAVIVLMLLARCGG